MNDAPTLVTGATGAQGGAVARALRAQGRPVRAMVRDRTSASATALADIGCDVAEGSYEDQTLLDRAIAGCGAVFSVQLAPSPADPDRERRQAGALVAAARRAGVAQFVHSSVSNTGDFETMAGWAEGRWEPNYWRSKADAEALVREAGFASHTLLRPAFMMENFAEPKAGSMFPDLQQGRILTATEPDTRIALVAADDIGAAAALAIAEPARFNGAAIELAGDHLTLGEVAAAIGAARGVPIIAETRGYDELVLRGQHDGWVRTQLWLNVVGYPARPAQMEAIGLHPISFAEWLHGHCDAILIDRAG
ncbi:NmrA family NAD(P)-binding protein [Rhizorhabdus dicambivorans]|uniref:NmrA family protein n=1 Tax=Rhizorhabdus dicambivorans TaxID=1850238 RepID=A0A2A4FRZ3_9SPHN|nr:NmrA family NAD(P)-binding protein [Rhizorhabdus dicambivorans]ATE63971.1 NmrA family protein [Rhizorhabdus dicambivorans]PCE40171.1 NmrA family protein [Rhizorhabdus dicambivorans]